MTSASSSSSSQDPQTATFSAAAPDVGECRGLAEDVQPLGAAALLDVEPESDARLHELAQGRQLAGDAGGRQDAGSPGPNAPGTEHSISRWAGSSFSQS